MLVRYARHNVRSLRKEEKPGRRFIVIDSVNSFPLPADGSEAILGVPMWVGGEGGLHLDVDLLTLRARLGQPAYLPDECRRQRRCRGSGAHRAALPSLPPSPSSIRMTKPRESWPAAAAAAAPKPSAAARTVFAILSILPLSSFVVLFRLHPPYMYSDTLCNMKG